MFFFIPKFCDHDRVHRKETRKKLIHRHKRAYFMIQRISLQIAALVSLPVVRVNDKRSKKPTIKENRSNRWNIKDTRCKRNILSNG